MNNVTTTADRSLDMMSLFDYLGRAAGGDLGKAVFTAAKEQKIPFQEKQVSNPKYTGKVMMYPKCFLDTYFKK